MFVFGGPQRPEGRRGPGGRRTNFFGGAPGQKCLLFLGPPGGPGLQHGGGAGIPGGWGRKQPPPGKNLVGFR